MSNKVIQVSNILRSNKKEGKYEKDIINTLESYFKNLNYDTIPHARFNISWGSIISDLDLLLIKDQKITLIEVKSSRDRLSRVKAQLKAIRDYVDFVYIATDYHPRKFLYRNVGLLVVKNGAVAVIKHPKKITHVPDINSVARIQKKCLARMLGIEEQSVYNKIPKIEMVLDIVRNTRPLELRNQMKEIVTCGLRCDTSCPIWNFAKISH